MKTTRKIMSNHAQPPKNVDVNPAKISFRIYGLNFRP
jgi:hypothetical protein